MKEFHPETRLHARHLYVILNRHLLEWMGSYQGFEHVTRDFIKGNLNIDDHALNEAIAVIKQWAVVVQVPPLTSVILRDNDVLHTHDFSYLISINYPGWDILELIDHQVEVREGTHVIRLEGTLSCNVDGPTYVNEYMEVQHGQSDFEALTRHFELLL